MLACSASALARPSSVLSRVSSSVRSCTRRSRDSLARSRSSAAFTVGVISVKVVDAAVRHRVCAHLHHQIAFRETLEKGLTACDVAREPFVHEHLHSVLVRGPVLDAEPQDMVEAGTDAGELGRQRKNLAELPVPADQMELLVEYGDALAHVIERGLQDFAIVV